MSPASTDEDDGKQKQIRTNLKKLGCLFEAFLGALFLDLNKISVKDEEKWFENVFVTGPGFQMAQIFVEQIQKLNGWGNFRDCLGLKNSIKQYVYSQLFRSEDISIEEKKNRTR